MSVSDNVWQWMKIIIEIKLKIDNSHLKKNLTLNFTECRSLVFILDNIFGWVIDVHKT